MLYLYHQIEKVLFKNIAGRIVSAVVLSWLAFKGWLYFHHDPEIRNKVVTQISKAADKQAKRAVEAAAPAKKPGSWERLLRDRCRDCN